MEYGLIGEHLPHSFSKTIHGKIGTYSYELKELKPEEVDAFLRTADFAGINVTIPYKQTVIPYLDEISEQARRIGAVNTIVNKNGRLCGYNTDYLGMKALLAHAGIDPAGKKVLILGTGGTSKTAMAAVSGMGAREVYKVSRTGKDGALSYEEAAGEHSDAQILVNTTPCGMFPKIEDCPVDLNCFPALEGVVDAREILGSKRNIVLTGMSRAGKTTTGQILAGILRREFADTDRMILHKEQRPITEIFATDGEEYFRELESQMIDELAPKSGIVIATGGGAILREKNVDALKKNGVLVFLDRPAEQILPSKDRPLANTAEKTAALYKKRYPIYNATCDVRVINDNSAEDVTEKILDLLGYD